MIRKYVSILVVFTFLFPVSSFSEEVNDYGESPFNKAFTDRSLSEINRLINDKFGEFVTGVNKNGKKECDMDELKRTAVWYLDQNFTRIGNTLRDLSAVRATRKPGDFPLGPRVGISIRQDRRKNTKNSQKPRIFGEQIERARAERAQKNNYAISFFNTRHEDTNIYKDTGVLGCCVAAVSVQDHVIGIDKIDHFFGNGGLLYEKTLDDPKLTDADILQLSTNQENGGWGLQGSLIKSYGDLNANWGGVQFYRELFDGPNPYFSCEKGIVTQKRKFAIEEHVHSGWSESTNCPAFPGSEGAKKYAANLATMGFKCPSEPEKCEQLKARYKGNQKLLENLVSPVCRGMVPVSESVEQTRELEWDDVKNGVRGIRAKDILNILKKGAR